MIKAVIFDVDGTLIDSKENHVKAWKEAFSMLGYDIPVLDIQGQFGRRKKETIEKFLPPEKWSTDGKKIIELKRDFFWKNFKSIKVFPGTYRLIAYLQKKKIKIALATSAKRDELNLYFKTLKIKDSVDITVSADEVKKSKPDPQTIQIILNKLKIKPEEALMVGDAVHDIESGKQAGVTTIGVLTGYTSKKQFNQHHTDYIFPDIQNLNKKIETILSYESQSTN